MPNLRTGHSNDDLAIDAILTPRETEVVELVVQARSNPEIAEELGLELETVKTHISRILTRLNARNRVDIAVKALQLRIVELGDLPETRPQDPAELTEREAEVAALFGEGLGAAAVGQRLGMSTAYVWVVSRTIRRKWRVNTHSELVRLARPYKTPQAGKPPRRVPIRCPASGS
jgi:DNA-binding NarL/FixJ family response regulator